MPILHGWRNEIAGKQLVAMLEGAAFFNLVVYIVTALAWPLVIAGILVMLMALSFPTPGGVDSWIERRFEELQFNQ